MINYLIQVSICNLLFYTLYYILYAKSHNHGMNRLYLLSTLIISIVIPLTHIPIFPETTFIETFRAPILSTPSINQEPKPFQWILIVQLIYGTVVLLSLSVIIKRITNIISIIYNGKIVKNGLYNLVYTQANLPLCSFATWIIVPIEKEDKLTRFELSHETCHINKYHTFDILFTELYKSFFWFNPIIYYYKKSIIEIHEYQADRYAAKHCGKDDYQSFILDQMVVVQQPSLVNNFNSIIKKRLIMMNSKTQDRQWTYLLSVPILFLSLFFFSFDSYPVYVDEGGQKIAIATDTIIPGATLDTLVWHYPALNKEVKRVVVHPKNGNAYILPSNYPDSKDIIWTDTISTIDYDTYKETMVTINFKTGVIDTLIK